MSEVLVHPININEAYKLFIKVNHQTYFPSFVYIYNTKYVFMYNIKISELADKIFGALTLN